MNEASSNERPLDFRAGLRWSAVSRYSAMVIRLAASLLTARILAPEVFGRVEMAYTVFLLVRAFGNFSLGDIIVQRKDADQTLLSSIFWLNLALSLVVASSLIALSPIASWFYSSAEVGAITAALSLCFLLEAIALVPEAMLRKKMRFDKLAVREIGEAVIAGSVSIGLALTGWGAWSIVLASIAALIGRVVAVYAASPFMPWLCFDKSRMKSVAKFGGTLTVVSLSNYARMNLDKILVASLLGEAALGIYGLTRRFLLLPTEAVTQVVDRVLLPRLAASQSDDKELTRLYLRATAAIALVTFPILAFSAIESSKIINLAVGSKWLAAVPLVAILAPVAAIQSISSSRDNLLKSKGRGKTILYIGIYCTISMFICMFSGSPWGLVGLCLGQLISEVVAWHIGCVIAFREVRGLSLRRQFGRLAPILIASAVATSAIALLSRLVNEFTFFDVVHLGLMFVTYLVLYGVLVWRIDSRALSDVMALAPSALRRLLPSSIAR